MKKVLALLLACVFVLALGACKPDTAPTQPTINYDDYEIEWKQLPDPDIVGAWKRVDSDTDEYYLFTVEGKIRVVVGTSYYESDISFGEDKVGNKSAYTESQALYGQWVYKIENETMTVTYPEGDEFVFKKANYTPFELVASEDFVVNEDLVGVWLSTDTEESYQFREDGFAIYRGNFDNSVYIYDAVLESTYTVSDTEISITYYVNDTDTETVPIEYSLDGDVLTFDGYEYIRQGSELDTQPAE